MQAPPSTPQVPAPPAPPAPPPGASGEPVIAGAPGRPLTAREISSLRARRTELSNQLQSADSRRERLSEALQEADGAAREGLEQRISLLDKRILQLESDIAETGRQLTSAPAGLVATTEAGTMVPLASSSLPPGQMTAIAIVFTLFVLAPLAIAVARRLWRTAVPPATSRELKEVAARLEHLEHAVDTVAIEVERVSEGQRYVTRILSETHAPGALTAGQPPAEPIRASERDAVPVRRAEP
jgi:hypothetical protein